MALYVLLTEACESDAKKHGQLALINRLISSVEETGSLTGFDFFYPTAFLKKGLGRSYRLLGYLWPKGEDTVVLFLRVLARGSKEYDHQFLDKWDTDTAAVERQFLLLDTSAMDRYYQDRKTKAPPPRRPVPGEEQMSWLYEVFTQSAAEDDDLLIVESAAWVQGIKQPAVRDLLALYHQVLKDLDPAMLTPSATNSKCHSFWNSDAGVGFIYVYRPDLERLALLEPLANRDHVSTSLARTTAQLGKLGDSDNDLARIGARCYPYLMVLSREAWLSIQKDDEANLALSPEEANLLASVQAGEITLPLFINGRAGSGKSTMLQYLAADFVDFALRRRCELQPLYMTCSRDLLEVARSKTRALLLTQHKRLLNGQLSAKDVNEILDRSFVVFRDYLYSLLDESDRETFPTSRYVGYSEFRSLWFSDFARRPEAKKISPDLAWHTLRSFVKGIRSGRQDDLDPTEFAALPRRRRSVSVETYQFVYDTVWSAWYKRLCTDEGYWDDQDLAATVLETGAMRKVSCPAVLCDEAQDFTSLELEIIFQLSTYARLFLQPEELSRVPVVFAGDPLQTINPTGFRWDAVQSDFHDRFCAVLDPRRQGVARITYRELLFNYRSNPGIVKFCNLIQLLRAGLFDSTDIEPQQAWWIDDPVPAVWFAADDAETKRQLDSKPELIKIINCEDGEEAARVRKDAMLQASSVEVDGVYRNVLSPSRAKGQEFHEVVLHRFSQTTPAGFDNFLSVAGSSRETQEKLLPFEYFLNRLYVAASRAKKRLVIVDSVDALQGLWRFATDADFVDKLMLKAGGPSRWRNTITFLVRGTDEWWSGQPIDPREQAREYSTLGTRTRDSFRLKQAALAYRAAGDEVEGGRCLALADEFDGKVEVAGDRYVELGLLEDGFRCYWLSRSFRKLTAFTTARMQYDTRLEARAANFIVNSGAPAAAFAAVLVHAAKDEEWLRAARTDATWQYVLQQILERLARSSSTEVDGWLDLYATLTQMRGAESTLPPSQLALVAYRAGAFDEAVRLWESGADTDSDEYTRAKAEIQGFPENVHFWGRLKDAKGKLKEPRRVLQSWETRPAWMLSPSNCNKNTIAIVIDAALSQNDFQLASELVRFAPDRIGSVVDGSLANGQLPLACDLVDLLSDRERVQAVILRAMETHDPETITRAAVSVARFLVRAALWNAAVRAAEGDFSGFLKEAPAEGLRKLLQQRVTDIERIFVAVVSEAATSDQLTGEHSDRRQPVVEFLNRYFVSRSATAPPMSPEVAGSAIERAGRIVDAIQYYEMLGRSPSEAVRRFAAERLIKNLERRADFLKEKGERSDDAQIRDRLKRAGALRQAFGFIGRQLPEYPQIRTREQQAETSEWVHGPFRIVISTTRGRLRILNDERFETVTVDASECDLRGDANFLSIPPADEALATWAIPDWEATVKLFAAEESTRVVAQFGVETFEFTLLSK